MNKKHRPRRPEQNTDQERILARRLCTKELETVTGGCQSDGTRCTHASDDHYV